MRLNISSTSISIKDNMTISEDSRTQTPFDLTNGHTRTKRFFPSKSTLCDENKLPSISVSKYHIATNIQTGQLSRKILEPSINVTRVNSNREITQAKSVDYHKMAQEVIICPTSSDFYQFSKHSQRIEQLGSLQQNQPNIYMKLNAAMDVHKCMPRTMRLMDSISDKQIKANGLLNSTSYVKMFSEGISSTTYAGLNKLDLNDNNLGDANFAIIADKIPTAVRSIQLKNNKLRETTSISHLLRPEQCLLELNLENNRIGDHALTTLLIKLNENKSLKILNLSKNLIQDSSMALMSKILKHHITLTELYLHYNKISNKGGCLLFKGLLKNSILKVLDMSFNKLGGNSMECTNAICRVIALPHPELLHLDLSHNQFDEEQTLKIANDLAFNRVIYGFHFEGSSYALNERGYLLKATDTNKISYTETSELNVEDDGRLQLEMQLENLEQDTKPRSNDLTRIDSVQLSPSQALCWICQGWVECVFHWKNHKSGNLDQEPIFLHLEFEDYRPSLMQDTPGGFILYRMCPPNKTIRYFFSNPVFKTQIYAKDQKTISTQQHSQLRNFGVPLRYPNGTIIQSETMHTTNFIQTAEPQLLFDKEKHYLPKVFCKPREPERIVEIDPELAKKRIWTLETSIFKDYDADTEVHLEQCLEADLDASKIAKHIISKNEIMELKDILKKYYRFIISCYKQQAAASCEYDFPKVTMSVIQSFFHSSKALAQMKQVDWEISLISTITMRDSSAHEFTQERCLVRYQFVELIVRLAKEVYIRNGTMKNISQALDKLLSTGYFSFISEFGCSQQWRDERLWTQMMDLTIRHKMPVIKMLFNLAYSFSYKKMNKEKFITLSDFKQLFMNADLLGDHITESDLYYSYLQSMMMQVDELHNSRHFQMEFQEFIEAIARVSEKISPNSLSYKDQFLNAKQRRTLPLQFKFEGLIYILGHRLHLKVDHALLSSSVLFSHEVKKLGIFMQQEIREEDIDEDPLFVINRLLHDDEGRQSMNLSSGSKNSSIHRQDSAKSNNNWNKLRQLAKRQTVTAQNLLQQLKLAQIENEMDEKLEYEESTPMHKIQLENRRQARSKYATIQFNGPQYFFDLQLQ